MGVGTERNPTRGKATVTTHITAPLSTCITIVHRKHLFSWKPGIPCRDSNLHACADVHAPRAPAAVSPQQPATCCGTCHISSQMGDQSHTSAVQVTGRSCSRRCRSSIARRLASCQIVLKQPHRVKQHSMPCSHVPAGDASSHPEACERIFGRIDSYRQQIDICLAGSSAVLQRSARHR